jgi:hypothetical protein
MKYAILNGALVVNVAEATPEFAQEQGWIEAPSGVGVGWIYSDGDWIAPPPPPPPPIEPITMRQARLELLNIGKLDDVDAALAAIPDEQQRKAAQIEWEYATIIERNAPLVISLTPALGLTETEMDDLFKAAILL